MERCFPDKFYWPQPETTTVNLVNLKQHVDESIFYFIERFEKGQQVFSLIP